VLNTVNLTEKKKKKKKQQQKKQKNETMALYNDDET
jgi:hypothetical protein